MYQVQDQAQVNTTMRDGTGTQATARVYFRLVQRTLQPVFTGRRRTLESASKRSETDATATSGKAVEVRPTQKWAPKDKHGILMSDPRPLAAWRAQDREEIRESG
jgi:hypothetical protein